MSQQLDVHPASPEEVVAAHRTVHDIWSKGRGMEEHVAYRLQSPTHRRAEWFVGCIDGRVVTSLAAHPVQFRALGETLSGIAIGSVYTVGEARGRGYAARLIAWVEDYKRQQGTGMSVLYSDIKPDYYARMGYVLCPSWEGYRGVADAWATGQLTHRLVPFAIEDRLPLVKQTYAAYYGAWPLSIERSDGYWAMMLEKFAADAFYAVETAGGAWAGYVLVGPRGDTWRIIDYALVDHTEPLARQMYGALQASARDAQARRVGGWLPDSPVTRAFFELVPRAAEITMIKPLAWRGELTQEMIAGASQFCELDHV